MPHCSASLSDPSKTLPVYHPYCRSIYQTPAFPRTSAYSEHAPEKVVKDSRTPCLVRDRLRNVIRTASPPRRELSNFAVGSSFHANSVLKTYPLPLSRPRPRAVRGGEPAMTPTSRSPEPEDVGGYW